jgi:biopolymer transport protein ExbB
MDHADSRARRLGWMYFAALFAVCWALSAAPALLAQADGKKAEQPAAEKAAGQGAPTGEGAAPAPPKDESYLWWFVKTSGFIGLFILVLSIYFVAQVITLFMEFRLNTAMPPALVTQTNELLDKDDFAGVYNALKGDASFYGRVLSAGMSELPVGLKEAQEVLDRHADACTVEMERKISMLAVLGTLGPMIGLLGTLKGMIDAFGIIARTDQQLKASEVAGAISEALLLTLEGVILAVPAIYFFAFFRNRMMGIATTTTLAADEFLRKFHAKYKARARSGAAAAAKTS